MAELPASVKKLQTTGTGAVVSELQNGDNRFLVIVNRDFNDRMQLDIELDPSAKRILKDGSIVSAGDYTPAMNVDPGDVAIYMW